MDLSTWNFAGLGPYPLAYSVVVVFLAAVIRGFAGFGFSAVAVTGISLMLSPASVVPAILVLEVIASVHMLPRVWASVDWKTLSMLLFGSAVSTPLGVYALATIPDSYMRVLISFLILTVSVLLWRGYSVRGGLRIRLTLSTGIVSGLMNGAAGVGGLAVVVMFLSTSADVAVIRATMVAFILVLDIGTVGVAWAQGLLDLDVAIRVGLFLVPVFLGILLGSRFFLRAKSDSFRRSVLLLLMFLSTAGLIRVAFG